MSQLLRSPAGVREAHGQDGLLNLRRRFVVHGLCGVRALKQAVGTALNIALNPFVAGLATDVVKCAEVGDGKSG